MKFNKDPPTEYHGEEFPSFNKVVNVSSCYYYLSLMERFVAFTQGLSESELKRFLVRAECRYFKWLMGHTFEKFKKPVPPPLGKKRKWYFYIYDCFYLWFSILYNRCRVFLACSYA
jgi:hypothetical protein